MRNEFYLKLFLLILFLSSTVYAQEEKPVIAEETSVTVEETSATSEKTSITEEINSLANDESSITKLVQILQQNKEQDVQLAIVNFLAKVNNNDSQTILLLIQLSTSDFPEVSSKAHSLMSEAVTDKMRQLLKTEVTNKEPIALYLAKKGSEKEIPFFIELLDNKASQEVAAQALTQIGVAAVDPLIAVYKESKQQLYSSIFADMGPKVVAALILAAKKQDVSIRPFGDYGYFQNG